MSHGIDTHPTPPGRRNVLKVLSIALGFLATLVLGIPIVGYYFSPVLRRRPNAWVDLGAVGDFPENETQIVDFKNPGTEPWDGATARSAAYVRALANGKFQVFAVNCAHLGCPVSWFPQAGLFLCPCHGGVYYADGQRASGPPPRDLFEYDYKVERGRLLIWAGHLPTLHDTLEKPKNA
jgi:nitrite reductase/ring-hydroxylating ferredoxin subunit